MAAPNGAAVASVPSVRRHHRVAARPPAHGIPVAVGMVRVDAVAADDVDDGRGTGGRLASEMDSNADRQQPHPGRVVRPDPRFRRTAAGAG